MATIMVALFGIGSVNELSLHLFPLVFCWQKELLTCESGSLTSLGLLLSQDHFESLARFSSTFLDLNKT